MQAIYNIAEICSRHNLKDAVLSPGSRCAPLTLAFVRHPAIHTISITDERSAAFIAMGKAMVNKCASILVCTSGTAALNYGPAVAESFYQQIPLLILTADRPPEWIDQLDGQTIRQDNIYGRHIKRSFMLPADHTHPDAKWQIERIISEAIHTAHEFPQGPVHINVPLREPLYSSNDIVFEKSVKVIEKLAAQPVLTDVALANLKSELRTHSKILLIAGQTDATDELKSTVSNFIHSNNIPLVADVISNFQSITAAITQHDVFLPAIEQESLQPDLLITFGKSVISKNLKLFLRKHKPRSHWHIQEAGEVADTFQTLTNIIPVKPEYIMKALSGVTDNNAYYTQWKHQDDKAKELKLKFFSNATIHNEFSCFHQLMNKIPNDSMVHFANSMPVRYANLISLNNKVVQVFANRGTSGIDGVISTAYGTALASEKQVIVFTGDLSFFYDRNAYWNNFLPSNLKVIVFNNHGGGIFRIIDGPNKQPELDEYFETRQMLNAQSLAKEFGINYYNYKSQNDGKVASDFFGSKQASILEIETNSKVNSEFFCRFKEYIKENF